MEQQRTCIEYFRLILGSSRGVNIIIIIAFYLIFFSCNQAIQLNPKDDVTLINKVLALNNLG